MASRLDVAAARRTLMARGTMAALFLLGACSRNGTSSLGHDNAEAGDGAMAGASGASSSTGGHEAATGGTGSAGASGAAASSSGGNAGAGGLRNSGGSQDDGSGGGSDSAGADNSGTGGETATGGRDGSGGSATGGETDTGGSGGSAGTTASGGETATGGSTASGGSTSTGGSGGSTYTCDGAPCCAAAKLSVDEIWVEQTSVTMIVELVDADGTYSDITADVVVPGGEATCSSGAYSFQFRTLTCNLLAGLDSWLTCGSTIPLQISLRSSTYSDTDGTTPLCTADGSMEIELDKTVLCPTCPSGLEPFGATQPCDIPDEYCSEASVAETPCTCKMDYRTGDRAWECPMPSGGS